MIIRYFCMLFDPVLVNTPKLIFYNIIVFYLLTKMGENDRMRDRSEWEKNIEQEGREEQKKMETVRTANGTIDLVAVTKKKEPQRYIVVSPKEWDTAKIVKEMMQADTPALRRGIPISSEKPLRIKSSPEKARFVRIGFEYRDSVYRGVTGPVETVRVAPAQTAEARVVVKAEPTRAGLMRTASQKIKSGFRMAFRSKFERQIYRECREDGMSDSEIEKWMREI